MSGQNGLESTIYAPRAGAGHAGIPVKCSVESLIPHKFP